MSPPRARARAGGARRPAPSRRGEFARGARRAAEVAEGYDALSAHTHRLGDCILSKLNLRDDPPRRNRRRLDRPDDAWRRGFATALAGMYLQLIGGGDAAGVRRVAAAAGLTLDDLIDAGAAPIDVRALRRAGVPFRRVT